jgi:hypothetical protein
MSLVFGSTFRCDKLFSLMKIVKLGRVLLMNTRRDSCESQRTEIKPDTKKLLNQKQ